LTARAAVLLAFALAARAEIVDRIAVTVGNQVITEGQIVEEIRVAAFLNHEAAVVNLEQKRKAAEQLIEQLLLKRDMDVIHYPGPSEASVDDLEKPVRAEYASEQAFEEDLAKHGINREELRRHLLWQVTILSYIEYRFQPSVQIPEADIKQYYEDMSGANKPSLEESRAAIEKILTQQRVDQAVDRWLGDTRTQVDIVYRKEAFPKEATQ
jgi:hypothetical protein